MDAFNRQYVLGDFVTGVAAAGTTAATATALPADHCYVSTVAAGADGVILVQTRDGMMKTVANAVDTVSSVVALKVYPWSGAAFNGQTADEALVLPAGKGALFFCHTPTKITAIFS